MDSLSMPSVSEQARDNNINKEFLLPRKPARQPNPIIYGRLRRGSAVARIQGKQNEYPTNKELLRTIAYLRNATALFYEPEKTLPYNKAYIHEEDDEEGITEDDEEHNCLPHDEKGKQELEMSMQKYSKMNSSHTLIKNRGKKSRIIVNENKEYGVPSSTSHVVVNFKDINATSDHGQALTRKLQKSDITCSAFMHFCSAEIICPQEHRAALVVKLYGVQAALLSALGSPFDNLSQSTSLVSSSSQRPLSLRQASTRFLPAMIWTGMFIVSFVYTVMHGGLVFGLQSAYYLNVVSFIAIFSICISGSSIRV